MKDKQSATTIIEINGVKMEVDLRTAKQVHENIKVGSKIKILVKEYTDFKVCHGVVVGFQNFSSLPTIEVCYLEMNYSNEPILKFASVNAKTVEKFEIVPALDWSPMVKKEEALQWFDDKIQKLKNEIQIIEDKKQYCATYFDVFVKELEEKSQ